MKSATETVNPTRVKLTVEVPFEELKPSLDAAYRKISRQITIPGFRRGKVPAAIVDQRIGRGAVLEEAVNEALPGLYMQALREQDVKPLSSPEIDVTQFTDGESLEFTAELDVVPEISLPEYEGLEVSVEDADVSDDDVEEQLLALRERFGSLSDVDRPAGEGDFVTIDLVAKQHGETLEGSQTSGVSYQVGKRTMLDGLDDSLVGMSAGDETTFESTLAAGEHAGEPADVEVNVLAVKEQQLPEVDDDFAQTASEFDTMAELRADLRERLVRAMRMEQASAARDAVLEQLLGLIEVPLPDQVVADELTARREQIDSQLSYAGMTMPEYLEAEGQSEEDFEADLDKRVRDSLAAQFVLDEVARQQQIGVDESELTQHIVRRAQQTGASPEDYAKHAMEHNHVPTLVSEVVRGKALALIVESASVTDASGNPVELKRLQPDGTYAAEDAQAEEGADAEEADAEEADAETDAEDTESARS